MNTYTQGISFKCNNCITKNDIITVCNLLNEQNEYLNLCEFQPEGTSKGGILFIYKDDNRWYKSVRFSNYTNGKWYWIDKNVMTEWNNNSDIIFEKDTRFDTFLKSFYGAPLFTLEELKIFEYCFKQVGIIKVGRYPSKKSLTSVS